MKRLKLPEGVAESSVGSPRDLMPLFRRWARARTESFFMLTLDGGHRPIHVYEVTRGLVNRTIVHPREVFWYAIKDMAVAIVVGHNHPSGRVDPSPEDCDITRRLADAGHILGIKLLDHLVVGWDKRQGVELCASMAERGVLDPTED